MEQNIGIIKSLIDQDLYKLTMQNAVCKLFPRSNVKYEFFNRDKTFFPKGFDKKIRKEIDRMSNLRLSVEEKNFLKNCCGRYLDDVYIDFLSSYIFDPSEVGVILEESGELRIQIEGAWYRTILWEVPIMAIVSELYFKETGQIIMNRNERNKNNCEKGLFFHQHNIQVTDFGTRRRYSYDNQLEVCKDLMSVYGSKDYFAGTSNVYIAMNLGLTPIGTHAHEFVSGIAALKGYRHANKHMMDAWISVYEGDLGTALPDTFGVNNFLEDFTMKYAKLYDGVRHDSGDPFEFIDKFVLHYKKLKITPSSKTLVFSDGLNKNLVLKISEYCIKKGDGIKCSFGIGTNFTNDVGVKPLNIVIKLINIDGNHAIKLSDINGKHIGDIETIDMVKKMINYPV